MAVAANLKKFYNVFKLCIPEYLVDSESKINAAHLIACVIYSSAKSTITFEVIVPAEYAELFEQGSTSPDHHSGDLARKPIWGLSQADVLYDDSGIRCADGVTAFECGCSSCAQVLSQGDKKLIRVVVSCDGAALNLEAYHFDAEEDGSTMSVLVSMNLPSFKKVTIKYEPPVDYSFAAVLNVAQRTAKLTASTRVSLAPSSINEPITLSSDDEDVNMVDVQSVSVTQRPSINLNARSPSVTKRKHSQSPDSSAPEDKIVDACLFALHKGIPADDALGQRRSTDEMRPATSEAQIQSRIYSFAQAMQHNVTLLDWLELHRFAMRRLEEQQLSRNSDSNANLTSRAAANDE